jgi:hypothetical protein
VAKTWGSSKKAANYRPAQTLDACCRECKFMFPRLPLGGCKYVRGVIAAKAICDEFVPRKKG